MRKIICLLLALALLALLQTQTVGAKTEPPRSSEIT
jgi:hypothetical protein